MLDWRRIVNNSELFLEGLEARGVSKSEAAELNSNIQAISAARVSKQKQADDLKAERNKDSARIAELMKTGKKTEAQELIARGKELGARIEAFEKELESSEGEFRSVLERVANIPHESVPRGKSAADNPVVRKWGTPRKFAFQPLSHDVWADKFGLIDFSRAAKVSGSRFTFLRGPMAQLERALANFMVETHAKTGYQEISAPLIVSAQTMYGMGQLPKFEEDLFKLNGRDQYLIPTAEVPVTSYFRDEILNEDDLPIKFVSLSPCFRSEAGSYGKDTKGLIRQHQFYKVELVKLVHPDQSLLELESMVTSAQSILELLEIPYQTIHLCTGDMGFNSRKTYDIEVYLPGSDKGCYREISSCSDCGDFQARRAGIRFRPKGEKGTKFVHTLNGSGLAVGRTLISVIENYQEADGSITVPKILRPYMGGLERISV